MKEDWFDGFLTFISRLLGFKQTPIKLDDGTKIEIIETTDDLNISEIEVFDIDNIPPSKNSIEEVGLPVARLNETRFNESRFATKSEVLQMSSVTKEFRFAPEDDNQI